MPATVLTAPPAPGDALARAEFWTEVQWRLSGVDLRGASSTQVLTRAWLAGARSAALSESAPFGQACLSAGVAFADLVAFSAGEPVDSLESADLSLLLVFRYLLAVDEVTLSVRDAVGWALVHGAVDRRIRQVLRSWVEVGLGQRGWLFAAAGLTPVEAADLVSAGAVDEDALVALAALRGVALPVAG